MNVQIPHLVQTKTSKQLVVNGKPFLILGGELQNSSMSNAEFMDAVWPKMVASNVNTLLGSITWEMIEPVEGQFDFQELDKVILGARRNGLHLVLLWFGSFKNGVSTYAPAWVKKDTKRFPRAALRKAGGILETADVLSIFHGESLEADSKAFEQLMAHVKMIDEGHSTVIMVQVENEVGLLGDSRDGSAAANERFSKPVPAELLQFLSEDWDNLHEDLKSNLVPFRQRSEQCAKMDWENAFGRSQQTDELFMAYHYAQYVEAVAARGRAIFPLPLFTNVWMNYANGDADNGFPTIAGGGGAPGDYPSGGATSNVLDVWQRFAPTLDFISPDIYLTDYSITAAKYRHRNQPLFIPEQRRDEYGARRIWIAYGSHAALGASPFGIDTMEPATNPFTKHYGLLQSISKLILEAHCRPGSSVGFCFDDLPVSGPDPSRVIVRQWGGYELTIERSFVFGRPGTGAGLVIHRGDGVFLLVGWGFQVHARALAPEVTFTGILRFEEKIVADEATGNLRTARVLNGDETRGGKFAIMPNEDPDYGGFPIAVTIPARTMIAELELFHV